MTVNWPKGKDFASCKTAILNAKSAITTGTVLVIDPSSLSIGYSITTGGVITLVDTLPIGKKLAIYDRIRHISKEFSEFGRYDVLVIERIRGAMAHEYLKWSVGAIIASVDAGVVIELPINAWKAYAGKEHAKSDANDAKAMANTVLFIANS